MIAIAITFGRSSVFHCLVAVVVVKLYNYNCNHLNTCKNCTYKKKKKSVLDTFPLPYAYTDYIIDKVSIFQIS